MSVNQKTIDILGDYAGFFALQAERLLKLGIDIDGLEVGHLAFRTETLEEYLVVREKLESISSANVEKAWNGRPISTLVLKEPLQLSRRAMTSLIELIPPVHRSVYKMGMEHLGFVLGDDFERFGKSNSDKFSGQQSQGEFNQPYFITFPDHTGVKFHRYSLQQVRILEGSHYDGFYHVID
ncbi:MAG TPA: VOC family protein [Anaerolineales bacterium]|nr:VOC family protein [Anaerolineales bacterium]